MHKKILLALILVSIFTTNNFAKETENNSELYEDVFYLTLLTTNIGALYYFSDQPKIVGSAYILAACLGVQGKTKEETTAGYVTLGLGCLYNFTRTNAATREEVFWTNVGLWSGFALYNYLFIPKNNHSQTNNEANNSINIQPMLGNNLGFVCSYRF